MTSNWAPHLQTPSRGNPCERPTARSQRGTKLWWSENIPDSKRRWSGAHGIGIQFQSLASPHQERLACTLQQLETQQATANTIQTRPLINPSREHTDKLMRQGRHYISALDCSSFESCSQYTTHPEPHDPCAIRQDDSPPRLSGPYRRHANHSLVNTEGRPWRLLTMMNRPRAGRSPHYWVARPCNLSHCIVAEIITSSLQCPLDSWHHGGTIGTRQHSQLRCSLEFSQKL